MGEGEDGPRSFLEGRAGPLHWMRGGLEGICWGKGNRAKLGIGALQKKVWWWGKEGTLNWMHFWRPNLVRVRDQIIFIWMNSNWIEFWGESKIGTPKLEEVWILESLIELIYKLAKNTHWNLRENCAKCHLLFGQFMREIWTRMREMKIEINEFGK